MNRQRFQTLMDYQMSFPLYTKCHLTMHGADRAAPVGKRRYFSRLVMGKGCSGLQMLGSTRPR